MTELISVDTLLQGNNIKPITNSSFCYINVYNYPLFCKNPFHSYANYYMLNNNDIVYYYPMYELLPNDNVFKLLNSYLLNLKTNSDTVTLHFDKVIFLTGSNNNVGHLFCSILNIIYKIRDFDNLDEYKIIIPNEFFQLSKCLLPSLLNLFFNNHQLVIVNINTIVKFNKSYIMLEQNYKINMACEYLINKLQITYNENTCQTYENIALIKTNINKCDTPSRSFGTEYNTYIENKGFKIIIPENYDIKTLYRIIYSAKNIILSWGLVSYINSIFVNSTSNVLIICHKDYANEYNSFNKLTIHESQWFPYVCNKKQIIYDLETKLKQTIKESLHSNINELVR